MKTDWFELRQARLHLAPYTAPHFPIAVASVMTPAGVIAAGRHGLGVLSLGAGLPGGPEALANQWKLGEETAAKHGKTMDRKEWRLVVNVHVAEDDEEALRQVKRRRAPRDRHLLRGNARPAAGPLRRSADRGREDGHHAGRLGRDGRARASSTCSEQSGGGFGGLLFRAHEWATREQTLRSYELFARYVMPRFQGSLETTRGSNEWARDNRKTIFSPNVEAIRRAFTDAGRDVPAEFKQRTSGARDE